MNVLVAGDFCPQNKVAELIDKCDYSTVLEEAKAVLSMADYCIVNFECPVCKGGEHPIPKVGPNLHCSEKGIEAIKWVGFNCVTLANNHFYDFGDVGVKNTIEKCRQEGIDIVGGGENLNEASTVLYKKVGVATLAIINCCEHEFSIANESHGGANPLNPVQQYYAIHQAKQKADFVLVIVHGGHEHWQLPSPRMKETYRFFVDAGADAVVNHHQHCYSGFEEYNGKPIFYGLGNFCFDRTGNWGEKWYEGIMIILSFSESGINHKLYPYHQCKNQPSVKILGREAFDKKLAELNAVIQDDKRLSEETEKYYITARDKIEELFEPIDGRYYLAGKRRGWFPSLISKKRKLLAENLLCCESHRDKLMFWFNK